MSEVYIQLKIIKKIESGAVVKINKYKEEIK